MAEDPAGALAGIGAVEGAVFGLLIAFTFSGAGTRFDTRRQLVVEETNAIGTAYLRLDLLPAALQPSLRVRETSLVPEPMAAAFTFSIFCRTLLLKDLISNCSREHMAGDVPGRGGKGQYGKRKKHQECD